MNLSELEIKYIFKELKILGVSDHLLYDELCDHVCCSVEDKLNNGASFKEAFYETINSFGEKGLLGVQKQTKRHFFEKYRPFRNLLITSFLVLLSGFFLKLFHLPGAGLSYIVATVVHLLAIFRLSVLIMKEKSFPKYRYYWGLIFILYFVIWTIALKNDGNIYPMSYFVIPIIFLFGLLCLFHFSVKLKDSTNTRIQVKYLFFLSLSGLMVVLCLIDMLDLLGVIQIHIRRFMFWVIVIEFSISCVYLIFINYFKNIAVLTLLLSGVLFYLPLSMPVLLSKIHINTPKKVRFVLNTNNEKDFYLMDKSFYLSHDKIYFQKQNDTISFLDFEIRDKWQLFFTVSNDRRDIRDIYNDERVKFERLFVTKDTTININR